jgi:hypothetical protein
VARHPAPVRFRQKIVRELRDHIARLGLRSCPVCGSETLGISDYPVLVSFGGFPHEKTDPRHDPEANVWFAAKVECQVCGYMMFFNSERFHHGDEPVLFQGTREYEAEIDPPDESE